MRIVMYYVGWILLWLLIGASPDLAQVNCPSGFTTSATVGACGISVNDRSADFFIGNHPTQPLSGTAAILAPINAGHQGNPLIYQTPVNVQAFSASFTFVGNGQNLSFLVENNQQPNITYPAWPWNFSAGAGGEGGFSQFAGGSNVAPIKTFALMLDSYSPLTATGNFTNSSVQIYQTLETPYQPLQSGQAATTYLPQWAIDKISTAPVSLNLPSSSVGVPSNDTFKVTLVYDGYTLTLTLADITQGGATFTHAWTGVYLPQIVGGNTAYVGVISGTSGNPIPYQQLIKSFVYTPKAPTPTPAYAEWNANLQRYVSAKITSAATPVFSLAPGSYVGTQSVTVTTAKTPGNYICVSIDGVTVPQPDNNGGCVTGTLYTGPISIPATATLYAMAGASNKAFSLASNDAPGIGPPSDLVAATYTITAPPTAEAATSAGGFVDSIGVNTHLSYTNSSYANFATTLKTLQALRVKHIRDGYYPWAAGNNYYAQFAQLKTAGIGVDFVVPYNAATTASDLQTFCTKATVCEALEYPNELDAGSNLPATTTLANALSTMATPLQAATTAMKIPLYGPSFTQAVSYTTVGNISQTFTANNLHIYFGGRQPDTSGWGSSNANHHSYGSILWWLDNAAIDGGFVPSVVTESGYNELSTATPYALTSNASGAYTLRTLFEMWNAGIKRTYLYELYDDPSSPNYGMMTAAGVAKRSYSDLQSLLYLLNDGTNPNQGSETGKLTYTLGGNTAGIRHTLLQKRDDVWWLVLWVGGPNTNPVTGVAVSVPAQQVTITLPNNTAQVIYNFRTGASYYVTTPKVTAHTYSFTVNDNITMIRIR